MHQPGGLFLYGSHMPVRDKRKSSAPAPGARMSGAPMVSRSNRTSAFLKLTPALNGHEGLIHSRSRWILFSGESLDVVLKNSSGLGMLRIISQEMAQQR